MGNQGKNWREIQRSVGKFKTMKSIHDQYAILGFFIFQNRRYAFKGRINLERMSIAEIILLKRVSAIHFL